jgi:hypothetical protein
MTQDPIRLEALVLAYKSAQSRLPISLSEFLESLEEWEVYPIVVDHTVVGSVLMYGTEIHACINEGYGRWLSKRVLRNTLEKILDKYGYATTSATTPAGVQFVTRLGFQELGPGRFVKVKNHGH